MNAESPSALPFNPSMFKWAREWRDRTPEEAAKRLNTKPENIYAWENGKGSPTVKQARQLADFYERSFLEFFLAQPPQLPESKLIPDFRLRKTVEQSASEREIKSVQMWAEAMRENALDLYDSLGEAPVELPAKLFATISDDPERAATLAREIVGPALHAQLNLPTSGALLFSKMIRTSLETVGILVLKDSQISKFGVRGICLFSTPMPVIVFGAESPVAQTFTMAHELAHVVLRQSAISGPTSPGDGHSFQWKIEDWCDRFAAAYLMPSDAIMRLWAKPNAPVSALGDDILHRIATAFKVSRHSMLIRLVHLGYVESDYYWKVRRPQFEEEERNFKTFGRSKYYGSRFRSTCGDLYTGLVLEAWSNGAITNHNAAEFMGTKSLKHLEDIRREFAPS